MENRLQLNASLRFGPDGSLQSRDVLINVRENSVQGCVDVLREFRQKFNLNLGLGLLEQSNQTKPTETVAVVQSNVPSRCPRCSSPLVERICHKPGANIGRAFYGCSNYKSKGCLYSYWPETK